MMAAGAVPSRMASAMAPGAEPEPSRFPHQQDGALEAGPTLGMMNVQNDAGLRIEGTPEAQGFLQREYGAFCCGSVENGCADHATSTSQGSRHTSPRTALSTHSFSEPKATSTPSMPGA